MSCHVKIEVENFQIDNFPVERVQVEKYRPWTTFTKNEEMFGKCSKRQKNGTNHSFLAETVQKWRQIENSFLL
jgi:hypothetical protein